jgi:hypothetical protein
MGAANPLAVARRTVKIGSEPGLGSMKVAAVLGDDVLDYCTHHRDTLKLMETGAPLANAYLGADVIVDALRLGADIVITGRGGDCSLFLAPMIHEFAWPLDDWDILAKGQTGADMVECAANVSGAYFADPGYKEVPNLANLGYPLLEVEVDGAIVVTKLDGTGGIINRATCVEQMLYEIHDPANYITPDVVVDFTDVNLDEIGVDRVRIAGGRGGRARLDQLKVSVGVKEGWIGEGELTFAGIGALQRAQLAEAVVRERFRITGLAIEELRVDYIGMSSLHGEASLVPAAPPYEVRLRVAGKTKHQVDAHKLANEVETLVSKGLGMSSLPRKTAREVLGIVSVLIPRSAISASIEMFAVPA